MHHDREPGESSDDSNRRRLGDDLLMDALLEARASDRREDLDRRVAAVMARVSAEASSRRPRDDRRRLRFPRLVAPGRAVAAAVLLVIATTMMVVVTRPLPAQASLLERAVVRLVEADRTFAITVTRTSSDEDTSLETAPPPRRADRDPRRPRSEASAPARGAKRGRDRLARLDGARLFTRGDLWTLEVAGPNDLVFAHGTDAEGRWNNFRVEDASRLRSDRSLERWHRPSRLLDMATLDVGDLLTRIDRHYEVSEPRLVDDGVATVSFLATRTTNDGEPDADRSRRGPGPRAHAHPHAHPHSWQEGLPESIEIWVDDSTEQIVLVRLEGIRKPGKPDQFDLEIALASEEPLPDTVFERAGYPEVDVPGRRPDGDLRRGDGESPSRPHRPGDRRSRGPDRPGSPDSTGRSDR
ncbi:MAG: hypothetical protein VX726_00725 [Planctomycetota bacterium]|nr:hypothetical protein [Planctomycetota bacterium]